MHDELILLVREEHVEKWRNLLKQAMESAEAKWLGDVPAIADVNVGDTWSGNALDAKLNTSIGRRQNRSNCGLCGYENHAVRVTEILAGG